MQFTSCSTIYLDYLDMSYPGCRSLCLSQECNRAAHTGLDPPFALRPTLFLCGIDSIRCWKDSSDILVQIHMIATHGCCISVGCIHQGNFVLNIEVGKGQDLSHNPPGNYTPSCTSRMQIYWSITPQRSYCIDIWWQWRSSEYSQPIIKKPI